MTNKTNPSDKVLKYYTGIAEMLLPAKNISQAGNASF